MNINMNIALYFATLLAMRNILHVLISYFNIRRAGERFARDAPASFTPRYDMI